MTVITMEGTVTTESSKHRRKPKAETVINNGGFLFNVASQLLLSVVSFIDNLLQEYYYKLNRFRTVNKRQVMVNK